MPSLIDKLFGRGKIKQKEEEKRKAEEERDKEKIKTGVLQTQLEKSNKLVEKAQIEHTQLIKDWKHELTAAMDTYEAARKASEDEFNKEIEQMTNDMNKEREKMAEKENSRKVRLRSEVSEIVRKSEEQVNKLMTDFKQDRGVMNGMMENRVQDLKADTDRLEKCHELERETLKQHIRETRETADKALQERTELLTKDLERVENSCSFQVQSHMQDAERTRKEHKEEKDQLRREKDKAIHMQAKEHRRDKQTTEEFHSKRFQKQQESHREDNERWMQYLTFSVGSLLADRAHEREIEERREQRYEARIDRRDKQLDLMIASQNQKFDSLLDGMLINKSEAALGPGPAPTVHKEMYSGEDHRGQVRVYNRSGYNNEHGYPLDAQFSSLCSIHRGNSTRQDQEKQYSVQRSVPEDHKVPTQRKQVYEHLARRKPPPVLKRHPCDRRRATGVLPSTDEYDHRLNRRPTSASTESSKHASRGLDTFTASAREEEEDSGESGDLQESTGPLASSENDYDDLHNHNSDIE